MSKLRANTCRLMITLVCAIVPRGALAAETLPAVVGRFGQEVALHWQLQDGLPSADIRDVELDDQGAAIVSTPDGRFRRGEETWHAVEAASDRPIDPAPPAAVRQLAQRADGQQAVATVGGVFERPAKGEWSRLVIDDGLGRHWAASDVLGVTYDAQGDLWFATRAGVGRRTADGWQFFTGRDGLPYNDFTCCAAASDGSVWFGTHRGAIRYENGEWAYRQGRRWLPHDDVRAIAVDSQGNAWFATAGGVGSIHRQSMTLAEKAEYYEREIETYIKRTVYGYVSEVHLAQAGDRQHIARHDSDNDGLWTAMYGAGECFAVGATGSPAARQRARQAFESLRFLQVVTQGGQPSPPRGYVARTIRSTDDPDPNLGRLQRDRLTRAQDDRLWKVYEPRWPKSADGKWYWKSDTSSDELDGHYFFYAAYYDLAADSEAERQRVRQVVRDLTDHLVRHDFVLQDHDGQPTRWAVFRPNALNHDLHWSTERGLNSLSILSYLAVARHITGDDRYGQIAQQLMDKHGYHVNVMVPKVQRGVGSGNQSDDEMAFMSFYNLVKYTKDDNLRQHFLGAFYWYWMLEQPERNPFFHFAYAAHGRGQTLPDAFQRHDLSPWDGWLQDSVATLIGFPLDRVDWAHQNSHRLDIVRLAQQQGSGAIELNQQNRGHRVDGKVLPVAERHFNHWNTDPWRLDTGGEGHTLASGTVFLLPYYMGLYHGFLK